MSEFNDSITNAFKTYLEASRSSDEFSSTKIPRFYISDMGKCLRMRYLKRKGIKGIYNWETYYTFAHGDFIHTMGYKALEANGMLVATEQSFGNEHFSGRYDGKVRIGGKVYMFDFKSTNPFVIKKLMANGTDNVENIMQILSAIILEKVKDPKVELEDVGLAIYVNKLPMDNKMVQAPAIILTKDYHLNIYKKEIEEDMAKIVGHWLADTIPPCTCPSWAMQKYNSYFLFCRMEEKEIRTHLKYLKAGNTITTNGYEIFVKKLIGKEAE